MNTKINFSERALSRYILLSEDNSKIAKMLLKAINQKLEIIKKNHRYGKSVLKNLIPDKYKSEFGAFNLFVVELPLFWRMVYTVKNHEIEIVSFIIDIYDHDDYNKVFGYKKK